MRCAREKPRRSRGDAARLTGVREDAATPGIQQNRGRYQKHISSDYGQYATAASQQEILFGQQFGQLNDRLTNIGNGICNLGYEMQGGIGQLGKEVALAQNGTNMTIMQTGNDIQRQMADCCCTTQRGLDAINANIDAKFAALEKSQLEGRIAQLEQANNQLYLREQMCGVVRYPSGYTYSAGNSPFCGCGCGNGNI